MGAERVEHRGGEVGLEQHVGLADVAPAGKRRAVEHHAVLEQRLVHRPRGDPDVLPLAAQVGEAEIDRPHVLGPDLLENGCAIRHDRIPMRVRAHFRASGDCAQRRRSGPDKGEGA